VGEDVVDLKRARRLPVVLLACAAASPSLFIVA
jgi:hypothetical protein